MKKLFLSICLATVSLLAIAKPPKKNNSENLFTYSANENLKEMYGKVDNLSWTRAKDNMTRANFTIEGEKLSAFFDVDGRYIATTTEITIEQLPVVVRKAVKAKSEGSAVLNLLQYSSDYETSYYFELSDGDKKTIYKVSGNGMVSKFN